MSVTHACADCLEEAGGRQRHHNVTWYIDTCPVCARDTSVTGIESFGAPELSPKILPFSPASGEAA